MKRIILLLFGGVASGLIIFRVVVAKNVWNQRDQFNLALVYPEKFFLLAVNPTQKTSFLVEFPSSLVVDTFGGYGEFKLNKIDDLACQEGRKELVPKTIENNFGFPLDFWFFFEKKESFSDEEEVFSKIREFLLGLAFSSEKVSLPERINLILLSSVLEDRSVAHQLLSGEREGFLVEIGGEGQKLNREGWDDWASVYLVDQLVRDEELLVGVYNATSQLGLAKEMARILTNSGVVVVAVRDNPYPVEKCLIGLKKDDYRQTKTFFKVKKFFPACETEVLEPQAFGESTELNIYLGKEFVKELKKGGGEE